MLLVLERKLIVVEGREEEVKILGMKCWSLMKGRGRSFMNQLLFFLT